MKIPKIWVLVDNRVGNANQAIVLAEKIGEPFEVKQIGYNMFGNLPNYLLSLCSYPLHIKKSIIERLKGNDIPDIIISSGRRTATLALYLKKISNNKTKIIQIMRPDLSPEEFDLIILPQHDTYNYTLPNTVRVIGALTNVGDILPQIKEDFDNKYSDIKNFIAVIIGGNTKKYKLTINDAKELCKTLTCISNNHSLSLFITFSRRTPKNVRQYIEKSFLWPNICHDPQSSESNPYPAMLGSAEFIIATPDSISMCSEAASSGKPLYIYSPSNFKMKKHNFFIQQLVDLGMARRIDQNMNYLDSYHYEPLSEIKKVVEIIRKDIL